MESVNSQLSPLRNNPKPDVLLVNAPDNYHVLGVQMVEQFLRLHGISKVALYPGVPLNEVKLLADSLKPAVVAFAVALSEQLAGLDEFASELLRSKDGFAPKVAVGGFAVRQSAKTSLSNLTVCETGFDILTLCGKPPVKRSA